MASVRDARVGGRNQTWRDDKGLSHHRDRTVDHRALGRRKVARHDGGVQLQACCQMGEQLGLNGRAIETD